MLEHPWLSMPDNYNFKMTDLEFKKYKLRQTFEGINNEFLHEERPQVKNSKQKTNDYSDFCAGARRFECNISDLAEEDSDINGGDREDNVSLDDSDIRSHRGSSLSSQTSEDHSLSFTSGKGKEGEDEFNLNVSFSGGYVPNTDLSRVDKG